MFYALYKGKNLVIIGTLEKIAKSMNMKIASLLYYSCNEYKTGTELALVKIRE